MPVTPEEADSLKPPGAGDTEDLSSPGPGTGPVHPLLLSLDFWQRLGRVGKGEGGPREALLPFGCYSWR
jgi:hypothetical protein